MEIDKEKLAEMRKKFMETVANHTPKTITGTGVLFLIDFAKYSMWKIQNENPKEEEPKSE